MKIAIDFDGTLVEHRYPEIGEDILFSFETLNLDLVHARFLATNPASGKVMENLGMRHVGSEHMEDRHDFFELSEFP